MNNNKKICLFAFALVFLSLLSVGILAYESNENVCSNIYDCNVIYYPSGELANNIVVYVNGETAYGREISVPTADYLTVKVVFKAAVNEEDVRIKAWIEGYKRDIYAETGRFDILTGRTYIKSLTLNLPSDLDATETYDLIIRIASHDKDDEKTYTLTVQRPSYRLEILSVEYLREVKAGSDLAVEVVVKNRGSHVIEDIYAIVRIPELGISKKAYVGDLVPEDEGDEEDAVEKTVILHIPDNAKSGDYTLEVEVYDGDVVVREEDVLTITAKSAAETNLEVVTSRLTQEVSVGGSTIYRIEIVNPTDEVKVITIGTPAALEAQGLSVRATPSVVTIAPNSAETVEVVVEASNATTTGDYFLPVKINEKTEDGTVAVKQVGITANVIKASSLKKSGNLSLMLTVVLGIVFIALVIVLLLSYGKKKGREETTPTEEETVYY